MSTQETPASSTGIPATGETVQSRDIKGKAKEHLDVATSKISEAASHPHVVKAKVEAQHGLKHVQVAVTSLAWLWPIRGIIFVVQHPQLIKEIKPALAKSLLASVVAFGVLMFFTYLPQAAILSIFTGPLGPILAFPIVAAESVILLYLLARPLFLAPALTELFDATLRIKGQTTLVSQGTSRILASERKKGIESALVKPFARFTPEGIFRYVVSLPFNFIPVVGTVFFLFFNGAKQGPGWHQRYFQLKGFTKEQQASFVKERKAEYTAFGTATLLFNFVPFIGLLFAFTNTAGAALWAAEIEARANILEGETAKSK
ncbi:hypothetical protein PUNSTDRAFT_107406 [Punctularia strigosozonata HHB-11173 SS5]|uniref:Uncharacterized protein n=1 Tax=Punctularia strigosozonata (strain HHB-11173) TaxID=741275 RepID=R7S592_PUNST|nr:uncharacterized protein PUNSTDRAFT_107406 [Punctularia strigosozonata HHB-11173 SS5]EIN05114.1 hypothetical protein PUNSTDRAFT_107406 [Punctularia strigosozonata HHB-11173 SS5]